MSSVPSTSRTRSRMLARPRCPPATRTVRVEADAVVGDGEEQPVVHPTQSDGGRGRGGVAGHVVQRLLGHAEQAERRVLGHDLGQRTDVHREIELGLGDLVARTPSQRLGQAELLEDRRVQLVREGVDVLAEAHEPLADGLHRLGLRPVSGVELGTADVDRQDGEPLAHVVVQFAREQSPLLLVRPDQAPAQIVQFLLAAFALGDVAQHAERLDGAVGSVTRDDDGDVLDPLLSLDRMQVAVLDEEPLQPAVVQPAAFVQHAGPVGGVQMLASRTPGGQGLVRDRRGCRRGRGTGRRRRPRLGRSPPRRRRGRRARPPSPGGPRSCAAPPERACAR